MSKVRIYKTQSKSDKAAQAKALARDIIAEIENKQLQQPTTLPSGRENR